MPRKEAVAPLSLDDQWAVRDARLIGDSENILGPFLSHVEQADFVRVHRARGEPVVMMSHAMWKRVLRTVEALSARAD